MNAIVDWSDKYNSFFQVIQVVFVIGLGLFYVGFRQMWSGEQQARSAEQQARSAEQQTRLVEQQTKLAELQLRYLAFEYRPSFEFAEKQYIAAGGLGVNVRRSIEVSAQNKGVKYLRGRALLFVEQQLPSGRFKRIAVRNFFSNDSRKPDVVESGPISFDVPLSSHIMAMVKFLRTPDHRTPWDQPSPNVIGGGLQVDIQKSLFNIDKFCDEARSNPDRQVRVYIELTYKTLMEDEVVDRFTMTYPVADMKPVAAEPIFDGEVVFAAERGMESADFTVFNAAINKALGTPFSPEKNYSSLQEMVEFQKGMRGQLLNIPDVKAP